MGRRNQHKDLLKILSLTGKKFFNALEEYLYEPPEVIIDRLREILESEKMNKTRLNNLVTLFCICLEEIGSENMTPAFYRIVSDVLNHPSLTDKLRLKILSVLDPEEAIMYIPEIEPLIQSVAENPPDLEGFLLEQLGSNPSMLHEIHEIFVKDRPYDMILPLIELLRGSKKKEVFDFLELLTYHENKMVALAALQAIEMAGTQEAVKTLYSISRLNHALSKEAEKYYVDLLHLLPMPEQKQKPSSQNIYTDLRMSLVDGSGTFPLLLGKKTGRGTYLISSLLFNYKTGIKDTVLFTNADRKVYNQIKNELLKEIPLYPVKEEFVKRVVEHALWLNEKTNTQIPTEFVILKNILKWSDLEPREYASELPVIERVEYKIDDLLAFPFNTWWLNEEWVYKRLSPYKNRTSEDLPDKVVEDIYKKYTVYLAEKVSQWVWLSAEILANSTDKRLNRKIRVLMSIRDEISDLPIQMANSIFLQYGLFMTIDNTLHNLSLGYDRPLDE